MRFGKFVLVVVGRVVLTEFLETLLHFHSRAVGGQVGLKNPVLRRFALYLVATLLFFDTRCGRWREGSSISATRVSIELVRNVHIHFGFNTI